MSISKDAAVANGDWLALRIENATIQASTVFTNVKLVLVLVDKSNGFIDFANAYESAHPLRVQMVDKKNRPNAAGSSFTWGINSTFEFMVNGQTSKLLSPFLRIGLYLDTFLIAESKIDFGYSPASDSTLELQFKSIEFSEKQISVGSFIVDYWKRTACSIQDKASFTDSNNVKAKARSRAAARIALSAAAVALAFSKECTIILHNINIKKKIESTDINEKQGQHKVPKLANVPIEKKEKIESIKYSIGSQIEGNYCDEGEWYAGVVASIDKKGKDTLYGIRYNDGDFERDVPESRLRLLLHFINTTIAQPSANLHKKYPIFEGKPDLSVICGRIQGLPEGKHTYTITALIVERPSSSSSLDNMNVTQNDLALVDSFDIIRNQAVFGKISSTVPVRVLKGKLLEKATKSFTNTGKSNIDAVLAQRDWDNKHPAVLLNSELLFISNDKAQEKDEKPSKLLLLCLEKHSQKGIGSEVVGYSVIVIPKERETNKKKSEITRGKLQCLRIDQSKSSDEMKRFLNGEVNIWLAWNYIMNSTETDQSIPAMGKDGFEKKIFRAHVAALGSLFIADALESRTAATVAKAVAKLTHKALLSHKKDAEKSQIHDVAKALELAKQAEKDWESLTEKERQEKEKHISAMQKIAVGELIEAWDKVSSTWCLATVSVVHGNPVEYVGVQYDNGTTADSLQLKHIRYRTDSVTSELEFARTLGNEEAQMAASMQALRRQSLIRFYRRFKKRDKIRNVDSILKKFQGREIVLYNMMKDKFGVELQALLPASYHHLQAAEHNISKDNYSEAGKHYKISAKYFEQNNEMKKSFDSYKKSADCYEKVGDGSLMVCCLKEAARLEEILNPPKAPETSKRDDTSSRAININSSSASEIPKQNDRDSIATSINSKMKDEEFLNQNKQAKASIVRATTNAKAAADFASLIAKKALFSTLPKGFIIGAHVEIRSRDNATWHEGNIVSVTDTRKLNVQYLSSDKLMENIEPESSCIRLYNTSKIADEILKPNMDSGQLHQFDETTNAKTTSITDNITENLSSINNVNENTSSTDNVNESLSSIDNTNENTSSIDGINENISNEKENNTEVKDVLRCAICTKKGDFILVNLSSFSSNTNEIINSLPGTHLKSVNISSSTVHKYIFLPNTRVRDAYHTCGLLLSMHEIGITASKNTIPKIQNIKDSVDNDEDSNQSFLDPNFEFILDGHATSLALERRKRQEMEASERRRARRRRKSEKQKRMKKNNRKYKKQNNISNKMSLSDAQRAAAGPSEFHPVKGSAMVSHKNSNLIEIRRSLRGKRGKKNKQNSKKGVLRLNNNRSKRKASVSIRNIKSISQKGSSGTTTSIKRLTPYQMQQINKKKARALRAQRIQQMHASLLSRKEAERKSGMRLMTEREWKELDRQKTLKRKERKVREIEKIANDAYLPTGKIGSKNNKSVHHSAHNLLFPPIDKETSLRNVSNTALKEKKLSNPNKIKNISQHNSLPDGIDKSNKTMEDFLKIMHKVRKLKIEDSIGKVRKMDQPIEFCNSGTVLKDDIIIITAEERQAARNAITMRKVKKATRKTKGVSMFLGLK